MTENFKAVAVEAMKNSYCYKAYECDIQIVKVEKRTFTFNISGMVNRHGEPLLYVCHHDGYKPYADLIF